jgi:hypothetical protein
VGLRKQLSDSVQWSPFLDGCPILGRVVWQLLSRGMLVSTCHFQEGYQLNIIFFGNTNLQITALKVQTLR